MTDRPSSIVRFQFGTENLSLFIPDPQIIRNEYEMVQQTDGEMPFPYWSKVWPSAIALSEFLSANRDLIRHKNVLEIGAGLALPSLFAARYAHSVVATDYIPESVDYMERSMKWNKIENMQCLLFDWSTDSIYPDTEVLLLSDINYDPAQFERILTQLNEFREADGCIILATPQRRMSIPFMRSLEPFKKAETTLMINEGGQTTPISIWVF